jgi:hypothetical protein
MNNINKFKNCIEKSVISFASVKNNKPHQIAVACVKVMNNKIIITDNFMKETKSNLKNNTNISLIFWGSKGGYELRGNANYFSSGKWMDFVRNIKENKSFKPKGAIVISINKIKKLK